MSSANYCKSIVFGALALIATGCANDPIFQGPPSSSHRHILSPPPAPHRYIPTPPAHKHAQTNHETWGYYYYPSIRVYFHIYSGLYYYPHTNGWANNRVLPPAFRLSSGDRIHLHIKDKKPWREHLKHAKKYKPRRDYNPEADNDKQERKLHKQWYKEQQKFIKKKGKKKRKGEKKRKKNKK